MKMNRVRVGQLYVYHPVLIDRVNPPHDISDGAVVRVVNLPGCPKAGTMGHCHVQHRDGSFAGLVCVNSLTPLTPYQRKLLSLAYGESFSALDA